MRIFLGEEGEEFAFPDDQLPESMTIEYGGQTGFADLTTINYLGEAGFEVRSSLDASLDIDKEPTDNARDEVDCRRYCDDQVTFQCCPIRSAVESFTNAYWIESGVHQVSVALQRRVDGEERTVCEGSLEIEIRHEKDDPRLQPFNIVMSSEVEGNFRNSGLASTHANWHETRDGEAVFPGNDWLFFHHMIVRLFDEWRDFYGYPRMVAWDGTDPFPTSEEGYTLANRSRPATPNLHCLYGGSEQSSGCRPPGWFTRTGDGSVRPDDNAPGNRPCFNPDGTRVGGGQTKLADFDNSVALGCVLNRTHHAAIHATIPGAMRWVDESTFDPIFWRYHKWASSLRVDPFTDPTALAGTAAGANALTTSIWGEWEAAKAEGPPGISSRWPPAGKSLAGLPGVLLVLWEPVVDLTASDLTVNGSPATSLESRGEWYFFSGFDSPGDGGVLSQAVDVVVEIAGGAFRDLEGNDVPAQRWSYTIAPDSDGDFIPDDRDNCPEVANRDQSNTDVDLVHGFHAHPGVEPIYGSGGDDEGDACDIDRDNDKLSDELEELLRTDPGNELDPDACPSDLRKFVPGVCGCGVSDLDRNGDREPECIPPLALSTTTTTMPAVECGLLVSDGPKPMSRDCLFVLRAAVALEECIPECKCALTGRMPARASDALRCLQVAVGLRDDALCPCPDLP